jgi:hypothetical protein
MEEKKLISKNPEFPFFLEPVLARCPAEKVDFIDSFEFSD